MIKGPKWDWDWDMDIYELDGEWDDKIEGGQKNKDLKSFPTSKNPVSQWFSSGFGKKKKKNLILPLLSQTSTKSISFWPVGSPKKMPFQNKQCPPLLPFLLLIQPFPLHPNLSPRFTPNPFPNLHRQVRITRTPSPNLHRQVAVTH